MIISAVTIPTCELQSGVMDVTQDATQQCQKSPPPMPEKHSKSPARSRSPTAATVQHARLSRAQSVTQTHTVIGHSDAQTAGRGGFSQVGSHPKKALHVQISASLYMHSLLQSRVSSCNSPTRPAAYAAAPPSLSTRHLHCLCFEGRAVHLDVARGWQSASRRVSLVLLTL